MIIETVTINAYALLAILHCRKKTLLISLNELNYVGQFRWSYNMPIYRHSLNMFIQSVH